MTSYIVLAVTLSGEENKTLAVVGQYPARSAREAVAAHVKVEKLEGGTFYAVPQRSFQAVTVQAETKTRLTFK